MGTQRGIVARMAERLHHRLYATLPVCPEPACRHIGAKPMDGIGGKMRDYCVGPIDRRHPKRRKEPLLFVESRAKVKADV